ncbi:MAG: hypothetical protein ABIV94_07565 [Acidimicrobiales bacterium]
MRHGTGRGQHWAVVVAALLVVGAVGWNAVQAWQQGWVAEGDAALIALRTDDVLSTHPPLLGNPTTAGTNAEQDAHHPGPLEFGLLALPLRALAPSTDGLLLGTALVNAVAVALTLWFAHRRAGPAGGLVAALGLATLLYGLGPEIPHDPYNPHIALLPLALLVTLTWAIIDGDRLALPVAVATGSLIAQSHAYEALLVFGFLGVAALVLLGRWRRASGPDEDERLRPWLLASAGLGVTLWLPPIIDQIEHRPGNLRLLLQEGSSAQPAEGLRFALDRLADAITPPFRFLSSQPSLDDLHSQPGALRLVLAAVVVAALGALAAAARRRHRTGVARLIVVALVGLALSTAVSARLPQGLASSSRYNHRHWWITGVVAWVALAVGAASLLPPPPRSRTHRMAGVAVLLLALLVVVPGARVSIGDDRGSSSFGAIAALEGPVADALRGRGPVLVVGRGASSFVSVEPGLVAALQLRGIDARVRDFEGKAYGAQRVGDLTTPTWLFVIAGDGEASVPAEAQLIARYDPAGDVARGYVNTGLAPRAEPLAVFVGPPDPDG